MNNKYKYSFLYIFFTLSITSLAFTIDSITQERIQTQQNILLKQAQTHFKDQVNTRKWNAKYGGVYVKPRASERPNPYLKDNILKVDDNLTLIRINPAWMTRQLSEQLEDDDFSFQITSLDPINPQNKANKFQLRALKYFEKNNIYDYFEISKDKFNYMGALITEKSCLACHQEQGYKLGGIRGGISISLNSKKYNRIQNRIEKEALIMKILSLLFLISITLLMRKQISNNKKLAEEVKNRTKEININKKLLHTILDNDQSYLLLSNGSEIIFANKPLLDFADLNSLEELENKNHHISDKFEIVDDDDFLRPNHDGLHWIKYIQEKHKIKNLKVLVKQNNINHYFKIHAKEINIDNKLLYLIIFDEITESYQRIQSLKEEASTDSLTGLFNRRKLDKILNKEIELAQYLNSELSIIFLDIDHFKEVNDTYGHDVGDDILRDLSNIIRQTTRKNDFIARWGGEEFMVTLQSTSIEEAEKLAQNLRAAVENHRFKCSRTITISLGVTQLNETDNKDNFTKRVDEALYEAKNSGRNRVVVK